MGATTSAPPPPNLSELDPEEQRTLLRNVQLMSSRNPAQPGRFLFADFEATHAAMSPRLRYALWSALAAGDARESLGLDAVVCVVVPLRHSPLSLAAAQAHLLLCSSQQQATGAELAEDAATWLASLGKPAPPTADVARVLATAACTAWLVDLRELEPLPTLSEGSSSLLQPAHVRFLSRALPAEQRREWRLLYTTGRDGTSFTRLVGLTAQRTPVLVVVRDKAGAVFGGFASEPLEVSPQFGGGYGSFLFALHPGAPALYQASGSNANLVYLNVGMEQLPNGLAFGAHAAAPARSSTPRRAEASFARALRAVFHASGAAPRQRGLRTPAGLAGPLPWGGWGVGVCVFGTFR